MSADVYLFPLAGRVVDAPTIGTVLVTAPDSIRWQITLRGYDWGVRRMMPRHGLRNPSGTLRWIRDGMAAAEEIAEAHGLGIDWHELAPRSLVATGVFYRG